MSTVRVAIAGSSGSIGTQTLDVIRAERGRYEVVGLGVGSSVDVLIAQANEFRPKVVAVADHSRRAEVAEALPFAEVVADLADLADDADVVVNGVVGFAGLRSRCARCSWASAWRWPTRRASSPARRSCSRCGQRRAPSWCPSTASIARSISACVAASMPAARSPGSCSRPAAARSVAARPTISPTSVSIRRWPTRRGRWARRSPSTRSTLMNKGLEVIEAHELFGTSYDHDRGGRAPAIGRALDGRVHRRVHDRPAQHARHAAAHRLRPGLPEPDRDGVRSDRLGVAAPARLRGARHRRRSAACRWPTKPAGSARRRRRGSARPTRSRSRPSSPGGSAGRRSPRCVTQLSSASSDLPIERWTTSSPPTPVHGRWPRRFLQRD